MTKTCDIYQYKSSIKYLNKPIPCYRILYTYTVTSCLRTSSSKRLDRKDMCPVPVGRITRVSQQERWMPGCRTEPSFSENLDGEARDRMTGKNIHRPSWTGVGDILLRDLLASSLPGEMGCFEAAHLPHETVGGGAPPLFRPQSLSPPRLPCLQLLEVGGLASAGARAPNMASVGGTSCNAGGGTCLASRRRTVGTNR